MTSRIPRSLETPYLSYIFSSTYALLSNCYTFHLQMLLFPLHNLLCQHPWRRPFGVLSEFTVFYLRLGLYRLSKNQKVENILDVELILKMPRAMTSIQAELIWVHVPIFTVVLLCHFCFNLGRCHFLCMI